MRIAALSIVALLAFGPAALAQQTTGNAPPAPAAPSASVPAPGSEAPQPGDPLYPDSRTGLDKVAKDGISTEVVKAAPCSAAARETDGTTTCIGIPDRR